MTDRSTDPHLDARFNLSPAELDIPAQGWSPYDDMHRERIRAHENHRDKATRSMEMAASGDPDWLPTLDVQVDKVASVLRDHRHGLLSDEQMAEQLRLALVQVGARTAAWIDALDFELAAAEGPAACRICGCTDEQACPGGCGWVPDPEGLGDLCSACLQAVDSTVAAAGQAERAELDGAGPHQRRDGGSGSNS